MRKHHDKKAKACRQGRNPKEKYPFPFMTKEEREIKSMEMERNIKCTKIRGSLVIGGAMVTGGA
jgi:hypothetical protein